MGTKFHNWAIEAQAMVVGNTFGNALFWALEEIIYEDEKEEVRPFPVHILPEEGTMPEHDDIGWGDDEDWICGFGPCGHDCECSLPEGHDGQHEVHGLGGRVLCTFTHRGR